MSQITSKIKGTRERNRNCPVLQEVDKKAVEPEIVEIIESIERNGLSMYPFDFKRKHHYEEVNVYTDYQYNMKYVLHEGKRMYFPENMGEETIRYYYNGLLVEQDIDSPHRYENNHIHVIDVDVVIDAGATEGIFSLTNIEKAAKIYLFECSSKWIKPLELTFSPWKEKAIIINKFISDYTKGDSITIDDFIDGIRGVNFIKADIEGAETQLLKGAVQTLVKQKALKLVLCTYHKKDDAVELNKILIENGYKTEFSKGYVIPLFDMNLEAPYIRRALIRAINKR